MQMKKRRSTTKKRGKRRSGRRGQMDMMKLGTMALSLVISGVVLAVGLKVTQDTQDTVTDPENVTSAFTNATNDVMIGGQNLGDNFSIIGTIIGLSAVLGLLVGAFGLFRR